DQIACFPVPAVHAGTGNDQISNTGQSDKTLDLSSHLHAKPGDLRDPSCDQRCLRVIAVAETVRDTGCQSDHIFQRASQLDPEYIRACIDTEYLADEHGLEIFCCLSRLRPDHAGRRKPSADLLCMARSR